MARLVPLSNHIAAQSSHLATLALATCLSDNILGKCTRVVQMQ